MEKLTAYHPQLGLMDKGKFKPAVKFMNFTSTVHDVLQNPMCTNLCRLSEQSR